MRGGTSKALFFHQNHLPKEHPIKEKVILNAFGSPDPNRRQMDGLGGGISTNSKVAIISPSTSPDYDVNYYFGQVAIDKPVVDFKGNCGNISSAVGPFAIDEGLVEAREPITPVRIFQKNTNKLIIAEVPVKDGRFDDQGEYTIDGVPGKGNMIRLRFADPGGAVTGQLFPTGNRRDTINVTGHKPVDVTIIDAANPVIFVNAESIGLKGVEIDEVDNNEEITSILEKIRATVAIKLNFVSSLEEATKKSQAVPKIAFVSKPQTYTTTGGCAVAKDEINLVARIMSMGLLHRSFAVSGAIATAGAAAIPGTTVNELASGQPSAQQEFTIGHPNGIIRIGAVVEMTDNEVIYKEAVLGRTARRLMEGNVMVPDWSFTL